MSSKHLVRSSTTSGWLSKIWVNVCAVPFPCVANMCQWIRTAPLYDQNDVCCWVEGSHWL